MDSELAVTGCLKCPRCGRQAVPFSRKFSLTLNRGKCVECEACRRPVGVARPSALLNLVYAPAILTLLAAPLGGDALLALLVAGCLLLAGAVFIQAKALSLEQR